MKTYVRIDDGKVAEIIEPMADAAGNEIPIESRFHPDIVAQLVEVTCAVPAVGDLYDGASFRRPPAPLTPTVDDIRNSAIAEIRSSRAPILDALAGIGYDALFANDAATATAVSNARQGLKDITTLPAFLAAQTYDDMKAAVMTRYRELADAAPDNVKTAFREVFA